MRSSGVTLAPPRSGPCTCAALWSCELKDNHHIRVKGDTIPSAPRASAELRAPLSQERYSAVTANRSISHLNAPTLDHTLACPAHHLRRPHSLDDTEKLMPGIINSPLSDSSVGAVAGMKRVHDADSVPTYGAPHPKKQKVKHQLRYTQPIQHIADPISAEIGDFGDSKEFFHQQLRRSVAIQCKAQGFDSASPEALEEFTGLVDSCMASPLRKMRNGAGYIGTPS